MRAGFKLSRNGPHTLLTEPCFFCRAPHCKMLSNPKPYIPNPTLCTQAHFPTHYSPNCRDSHKQADVVCHKNVYIYIYIYIYMGGCQKYGPFLGILNIRCRIIIGTQKRDHNFENHLYIYMHSPEGGTLKLLDQKCRNKPKWNYPGASW